MLTLIIDALRAHWLGAVIGTSIFAVFATVSLQRFEITHLKKQTELCRLENMALENANKALASSIEIQNAAIAAWQTKVALKAKKAAAALVQAYADAKKFEERAKRIEAEKFSGNECTDVKQLVDEYLENGQ